MKVEDLSIKVTYNVGLGNVKMPKKVYKQLLLAAEKFKEIDPTLLEDDFRKLVVDAEKKIEYLRKQSEKSKAEKQKQEEERLSKLLSNYCLCAVRCSASRKFKENGKENKEN